MANPRTLTRLRAAGAVDPRAPIAIARALPWLVGRGPSLGILSKMHAVVLRDKTALIDRKGNLTWKQVDERANRAARMLETLGLRGSDRVATVLRNGREQAEIILGAQKAGFVACPLNTWAKEPELRAILEQSDPKVLVYDPRHSDDVAKVASNRITLVAIDGGDERADITYDDLLDSCSAAPPAPFARGAGSARVVIHTSGTTGKPKGASRDATAAGVGALANMLGRVPYRRDDIFFCPAPLFHSFGLATFTFATALGATLVLPDRFDPEDSLRQIDEHEATAASFVPVMMRRLVSLPDEVKARYDTSSLRVVLASGSVLTEDLRAAARDLLGDVLYDLYGSTEVGWVAIATPDDMRSRPGTVGRPVEGIEIAVFSPEGERLPPGETGGLYIKSDVAFEGYTSGESKEERDGYMSIGDLGHFDDAGYLYVASRSDDMVVVGGENVYPIEVEQVIESVAGVDEVTVLGIEDEEYGSVLAAFAVGSATPQEIRATCEAQLASFKVPRRIEVLPELPRTSTGKVVKRELLAQLAEGT